MKIGNPTEPSFHSRARRQLLKNATLFAGSLALPKAALLAESTPELENRRLSESALLVIGPDANVLVLESDEGLILVDGGHASWADRLHLAIAESFPGVPSRALINSHWHPEQTGSNVMLGSQGVEIIAHENTWLWLGTEVRQKWSGITFPPLPAAGLPGTVVLDSENIRLADIDIELHYLWNSHTDGDLAVHFPDQNILMCGGMVSNGQWPDIDWWTGGYIGGMLDSFLSLLTVPNAETTIIPAYGPVMSLDELRQQNAMYLTIFERMHALFNRSYSLEDILAEKPTAEYDALMGDPTRFLTLAHKSMHGHLRDPQNFRLLNYP